MVTWCTLDALIIGARVGMLPDGCLKLVKPLLGRWRATVAKLITRIRAATSKS
jgi:hypothetical protein